MGADRFTAGQLPRSGAVSERLASECTYRANINHVSGKFRINRLPNKGFNLGMLAPVGHA